ncbi:MAG TPA: type II toxin-antitoxin system VapC family toxin [Polyangia bacterium]
MTNVVADTHALVWHLSDPRRLGKAARRAFAAADAGRWTCHVPVIALVEIALLQERGRIRLGPAQVLDALAGHPGYNVLPLDLAQALEFGALPAVRDPMDRLVLAAARVTGARVISVDDVLDGYGVERLWE